MQIHTLNVSLTVRPPLHAPDAFFAALKHEVEVRVPSHQIPLRFAVTAFDGERCEFELDVLDNALSLFPAPPPSIFSFRKRQYARSDKFNVVFLIPTGTDCEIGGHAGDATPALRLLAGVADKVILHPNVVNASDLNEQPDNALYVEGGLISQLLMGTISLNQVRQNRILMVTEERHDSRWPADQAINTVNAANAVLGTNCVQSLLLKTPLRMSLARSPSGRPGGKIAGLENLVAILMRERPHYDAVALATRIAPDTSSEVTFHQYFKGSEPNPWGGVEAMLTHAISMLHRVPTAHAPTLEDMHLRTANLGQVDPRKAAEAISHSYMFCILKGLHRAPQIIYPAITTYDPGCVSVEDIACLVVPDHCLGLPTLAAMLQGIDVIAVRGNGSLMKSDLTKLPFASGKLHHVENYFEAAGLAVALKQGIAPRSIRRPLAPVPCEAR